MSETPGEAAPVSLVARAIRGIRQRFPDLFIDLNILKIEETLDYLLAHQRIAALEHQLAALEGKR